MSFNNKYIIHSKMIPKPSKRRSGLMISKVRFLVAHDTGNKNSTAAQNVNYYINSHEEKSASAHLFVDDKEIIECVPALTASPEKAWHVLYNVPKDNELYGVNANDAAIGVEYCFGDNIDADKAYAKFVWLMAKLCFEFALDPEKDIVGHFFLDPARKSDPVSGLANSRRTYERFLKDIVLEYNECIGNEPSIIWETTESSGTVTTNVKLNMRKEPRTMADIIKVVPPKTQLTINGIVTNGEKVNNNPIWYVDSSGNYFWSGGVTTNEPLNTIPNLVKSVQPISKNTTSLDLPINYNQCIKCSNWMNTHFGEKFNAALIDSPFRKEILYAIVCQETAIYWQKWIEDHTPDEILARCVFDANGDVNGTRKAFPKNTAAFVEKYGQVVANNLIEEANTTRKWRGFDPKNWVYAGYGIFQYDIQFIVSDELFFTQKGWHSIDECIKRVMKELETKWKAHPDNLFETIKAYNGRGAAADNYAKNVFQFLSWIENNGLTV